MALKVIGSGLGRTGTLSTKLALEQLGFTRCHHMAEVFMDAGRQVPLWNDAGDGKPDWDAIFDGFQAMVDHPGCGYWRELMDYYPDAKVLHTVRDPDKWFDSTQATIFAPENLGRFREGAMATFFGHLQAFYENGDMNDRAFMTDFFRRHTERVVATVPKERLLVFNVAEGWEPLCAFLGVPVPDTPYPRENSTEQFRSRAAAGAMPVDPAKIRAEPAK
ncbi:MAG: hypothetical protein JNK30_18975 [Phenylobacterium sp.]|uniref:sulfotransferase family protein n=1 Tax=Phenylobacterium sp. TaxID=1871053 RepID=UPI001A54FE23|nr:sulfotransferase family protein [Phenylobacterium sp.]MBL8773476.1 hypothetical protein [Phenylobacterium sp.]